MHEQTKTLDDETKGHQRNDGTGPSEESTLSRKKNSGVIQIGHILALKLRVNAAILCGFRELVKDFWKISLPTVIGQHIPVTAAMDGAPAR
jgi:hypothetical protein